MLHPFRRPMPVPATHQPTASVALVTPNSAAGWLEAEWRNILQAAQYAGRHEWKQKCADLIHVLGGFLEVSANWDEAIAAHTLALQAEPRPGRSGAGRTGLAGAQRGEPADRAARSGTPAGRGGCGDLPVAGRPAW